MLLLHVCCRGRGRCARMDVRAALAHAEMRARRSRRDQNIRYADGAWQITEAPPRRRITKERKDDY